MNTTIGQTVFSKRLTWAFTTGLRIRQQYGVGSGYISMCDTLTVRKARDDYHCRDCGKTIHKGEPHGSAFYDHYCLDCVTLQKPETQFKAKWG